LESSGAHQDKECCKYAILTLDNVTIIIRIIKSRMGWAGHGVRMGRRGKPEGKRPLGRPRRRWVDNINMDIAEIGLCELDWIGLAQDRYRWKALVNAVMNLRVP
jgi:hypothetical protein